MNRKKIVIVASIVASAAIGTGIYFTQRNQDRITRVDKSLDVTSPFGKLEADKPPTKQTFLVQLAGDDIKHFAFFTPGQGEVVMDAKQDAIALVMLSPAFTYVKASEKARIARDLPKHPRYGELVQVIENETLNSAKATDLSVDISNSVAPKPTSEQQQEPQKSAFMWPSLMASASAQDSPKWQTNILEQFRYQGALSFTPDVNLQGTTLPIHKIQLTIASPGIIHLTGKSMLYQGFLVLERGVDAPKNTGRFDPNANLKLWDFKGGLVSTLMKPDETLARISVIDIGPGVRDVKLGALPGFGVQPSAFTLNAVTAVSEGLGLIGFGLLADDNKLVDRVTKSGLIVTDCETEIVKQLGDKPKGDALAKGMMECLTKTEHYAKLITDVIGSRLDNTGDTANLIDPKTGSALSKKWIGSALNWAGKIDSVGSVAWVGYWLADLYDQGTKGPRTAVIENIDLTAPKTFVIDCGVDKNAKLDKKFDQDLTLGCGSYDNLSTNWYVVSGQLGGEKWERIIKPSKRNVEFRLPGKPDMFLNPFNAMAAAEKMTNPVVFVEKFVAPPSREVTVVCDAKTPAVFGVTFDSRCSSTGANVKVSGRWFDGMPDGVHFSINGLERDMNLSSVGEEWSYNSDSKTQQAKVTVLSR